MTMLDFLRTIVTTLIVILVIFIFLGYGLISAGGGPSHFWKDPGTYIEFLLLAVLIGLRYYLTGKIASKNNEKIDYKSKTHDTKYEEEDDK